MKSSSVCRCCYYYPSSRQLSHNDLTAWLPSGVTVVAPADAARLLPTHLAAARRGECRIFLDCPDAVPGIEFGAETSAGVCRTVVADDWFGAQLPALSIVIQHNFNFRAVKTPVRSHLVGARVAGYRRACFGLPETQFPLLFEHPDDAGVLISATPLSGFIAGRFTPREDWQRVIGRILGFLDGSDAVKPVSWEMTVRPSYAAAAPLPADAEMTAFQRNVQWFYDQMLTNLHRKTMVFEGYSSAIDPNGNQRLSTSLRCDCTGEFAMLGALDHVLNGSYQGRETAQMVLDSLFRDRWLIDGNPASQTYGSIFFDTYVNSVYGDDCARAAFGALLSDELLDSRANAEAILRLMLSVYRTTGKNGLRHESLQQPVSFQGGKTWKYYFDEDFRTCRPHYMATTWALNLQAYALTGFADFLTKAKSAITIAMTENFPDFLWTNGITQEHARIILPLAMLVEVEDTPQHRQWLDMAVRQLLSRFTADGAIAEAMGKLEKGRYPAPRCNEDYGTNEAALIQENGDPACDLLYTMSYAFLGLHEAAMATGNAEYRAAEDKMAEFFCRIQVCSTQHEYLSGCWMRGFDFKLWDYFGSSADVGWGAWCVESGWTNSWIAATLGLRKLNRPLLSAVQSDEYRKIFPRLRDEMLQTVLPSVTYRGLSVTVDTTIPLATPGGDGA